jgi:hypothetical protein
MSEASSAANTNATQANDMSLRSNELAQSLTSSVARFKL